MAKPKRRVLKATGRDETLSEVLGVPPLGRGNKVPGGSIADLGPEQYDLAWKHYCTAATKLEICKAAGITDRQLVHLHSVGLPGHGLEAFQIRLLNEIQAIRETRLEAAKKVGGRSLDVLEVACDNASTANRLVKWILHGFAKRLAENEQRPEDSKEDQAAMMPTQATIEALKALRPYCDLTSISTTYRHLYADASLEKPRAIPPPPPAVSDASNLPAMAALVGDDAGDAALAEVIDAAYTEIKDWSPDEIRRYAETGKEAMTDDSPE